MPNWDKTTTKDLNPTWATTKANQLFGIFLSSSGKPQGKPGLAQSSAKDRHRSSASSGSTFHGSCQQGFNSVSNLIYPLGSILKWGVPPNHPFLDGIFPYKPSFLGYPHGNPHFKDHIWLWFQATKLWVNWTATGSSPQPWRWKSSSASFQTPWPSFCGHKKDQLNDGKKVYKATGRLRDQTTPVVGGFLSHRGIPSHHPV